MEALRRELEQREKVALKIIVTVIIVIIVL